VNVFALLIIMEESNDFSHLLKTLLNILRRIGLIPLALRDDNSVEIRKRAVFVSCIIAVAFLVFICIFHIIIFLRTHFFQAGKPITSTGVLLILLNFFMFTLALVLIEFLLKTTKKVISLLLLIWKIDSQIRIDTSKSIHNILILLFILGVANILSEQHNLFLSLANEKLTPPSALLIKRIAFAMSYIYNDLISVGFTLFALAMQMISLSFFKAANLKIHSLGRNGVACDEIEKLRLAVRNVFDAVDLTGEIIQKPYLCLLCARNISIQLSTFTVLQTLYKLVFGLEQEVHSYFIMLLRDLVFVFLQFLVPSILEKEVSFFLFFQI